MEDLAYQITPELSESAVAELITIRDMLRWAASQFEKADLFYGHGTDNPWDEAVAVVIPAIDLPLESSLHILDARLTEEEREEVLDAITRRVNEGIPSAYIHNQAYFNKIPFFVDERVIVPRSPMAELIADGFEPLIHEAPEKVLDMCTGSGCIAIATALQFEDAELDAVDISDEALEVARINVDAYSLEDRVQLIKSDLFKSLPKKAYDLIIANPPYVPTSSISDLPEEFLSEPEMALVAGDDGLACIRPILQHAADYLSDDGLLVMEVGEAQEYVEEAFPDVPFTWLEFENGGEGVFCIKQSELAAAKAAGKL
jgi:ribosomal protein L3 glutamine methyltransferase